MKYGLLFSGQGAQRPGMGIDFLADPLFKRIVEEASAASELDLVTVMKGENGELSATRLVQPALATVSYGIYRMLVRDLELPVAGMVGLSLGEYPALFAAGAVDFASGMALLAARARYMEEDALTRRSGLLALIDYQPRVVDKLLEAAKDAGWPVDVANYNSPRQMVVGGAPAALADFAARVTQSGAAKRAVALKVAGAFHTPFFNGARTKMGPRLAKVAFQTPRVPVYSNTLRRPFTKENLPGVLARQLAVPTHFGAALAALVEDTGTSTTIEIGPGKVLSRFARQVTPSLHCHHVGTMKDYQTLVQEVSNGING